MTYNKVSPPESWNSVTGSGLPIGGVGGHSPLGKAVPVPVRASFQRWK